MLVTHRFETGSLGLHVLTAAAVVVYLTDLHRHTQHAFILTLKLVALVSFLFTK